MHFQNSTTPDIHPDMKNFIRNAADWTIYHPSINTSDKPAARDAGMTFENLLRVPINSRASADLEQFGTEVKTGRDQSGSLLTLFTKNPVRKLRHLTKKFGTDDSLGRTNFYHTHSNKNPNALFLLDDAPDKLLLLHDAEEEANWGVNPFKKATGKLDRVCYAKVSTKVINGLEYFKFHSFELYYGFKAQVFYDHLLTGDVFVDFRAHYDNLTGKFRDHGTAFRVHAPTLPDYYNGSIIVDLSGESVPLRKTA